MILWHIGDRMAENCEVWDGVGKKKWGNLVTGWEDNEEIRINMDTLLPLSTWAFLITATFLKERKQTCFLSIFSFSKTCAGKKKCTYPWLFSSYSSFPFLLLGPQYKFFILLVEFRVVRMFSLWVVILTHFREVWIPTHPVSCLTEGNMYLNLCLFAPSYLTDFQSKRRGSSV